jgi:hypothetical protein
LVILLAGAGMLGQRPAQAQDTPDPKTVAITGTFRHGNKTGTISGTFTVQRFGVVRDTLVAFGQFSGTATSSSGKVLRSFSDVPLALPVASAELVEGMETTAAPFRVASRAGIAGLRTRAAADLACPILNLTLGPLDLNLLGLQIHLDQVVLVITADPTGGLLGQLLCGLLGLLGSLLGFGPLLAALLGLLGSLADVAAFLNALLALLG